MKIWHRIEDAKCGTRLDDTPLTIHNMNTKPLLAAFCAAFIATCSHASARSPQPRVESGTIETVGPHGRVIRSECCFGTVETIDQDARSLRIRRDGEALPLTLVWNRSTSFIEGTRFVTAAELTKGARVTVWYHTPFFGKPFATKIVIDRSAARHGKARK